METIKQTLSEKDERRLAYHAHKQDHGTRGTQRDKEKDYKTPTEIRDRDEERIALDERLSLMSPSQLEKAATAILKASGYEEPKDLQYKPSKKNPLVWKYEDYEDAPEHVDGDSSDYTRDVDMGDRRLVWSDTGEPDVLEDEPQTTISGLMHDSGLGEGRERELSRHADDPRFASDPYYDFAGEVHGALAAGKRHREDVNTAYEGTHEDDRADYLGGLIITNKPF
ncbi:MAG TPA: hypothetical protein VG992_04120 [Candidatus Saccharimonadales bacterium]|nr:hypothetical protein [Candidatus Saccharimonadales bacterium]